MKNMVSQSENAGCAKSGAAQDQGLLWTTKNDFGWQISQALPNKILTTIHNKRRNHKAQATCGTRKKWIKKIIQKSRECHNHKPQPIPDT